MVFKTHGFQKYYIYSKLNRLSKFSRFLENLVGFSICLVNLADFKLNFIVFSCIFNKFKKYFE